MKLLLFKEKLLCTFYIFITLVHRSRNEISSNQCLAQKSTESWESSKDGEIIDSVSKHFKEIDIDDSSYLIVDEVIQSVQKLSNVPLTDAETVELAASYLNYLDDNGDGVIDVYELRFNLYAITQFQEKFKDKGFVKWMRNFVDGGVEKYSFYLVKIYQLFDEDLNGKLTWKEIRMTIKLAETFRNIHEGMMRDERGNEELVASIKIEYQQKWLSLEEFSSLLEKLEIGYVSYIDFYEWMVDFLKGSDKILSSTTKESTRKEFSNVDTNGNGIISKGELTATLHNHRANYYTYEIINRKWTRADRNKDGVISFNEYEFLENLKHPDRK